MDKGTAGVAVNWKYELKGWNGIFFTVRIACDAKTQCRPYGTAVTVVSSSVQPPAGSPVQQCSAPPTHWH